MLLQINFKSGLPIYLQIVEQVKAAAASGAIKPGERLPSIRPLAEELRVNRNTVAKAYSELESQGVIETLPPTLLTQFSIPSHFTLSPTLVGSSLGMAMDCQGSRFCDSRRCSWRQVKVTGCFGQRCGKALCP